MTQCKHDDNDCQNFKAVEAEAVPLPDLSDLQKCRLSDLAEGEEVLMRCKRVKRSGDDSSSVGVEFEGEGSWSFFSALKTTCYRGNPKKIRADQVPDGRRFKRTAGGIRQRVCCAADNDYICAPDVNSSRGCWGIDGSELVTLLDE